jgi:predicted dithiol-disulfide oxidoreductase (DUF899 family)
LLAMNMLDDSTPNPKIVSRDEWIQARKAHLDREKHLTRLHDQLSAERRALPWVEVDKTYAFEGPGGRETLSDLFDGRSQLIVYHFMFGPGWKEGCTGCSFVSDHIDGANLHLANHDVTLLAVSRAPYAEFQDFKRRMGWAFKWVSSAGSDFNADYHVYASETEIAAGRYEYNYELHEGTADEHHGISVFYKNPDGRIFHTYSSYARGGDILIGAHHFLDLTPKGRNEESTMDWVRLHDRYEDRPAAKGNQASQTTHDCCAG